MERLKSRTTVRNRVKRTDSASQPHRQSINPNQFRGYLFIYLMTLLCNCFFDRYLPKRWTTNGSYAVTLNCAVSAAPETCWYSWIYLFLCWLHHNSFVVFFSKLPYEMIRLAFRSLYSRILARSVTQEAESCKMAIPADDPVSSLTQAIVWNLRLCLRQFV